MRAKKRSGYTLIELMLVVAIMGLLTSIISPHYDMLLQKANQAATKHNLGSIRSAMNMYYSELEGKWPLHAHAVGDTHYTVYGESLATTLIPKYLSNFPTPKLLDRNPTFNDLGCSYDAAADTLMKMNPPKDVFKKLPVEFFPTQ